MTQYRPISDLHSEIWDENPGKAVRQLDRIIPPLPDDADTILLLAGDTGSHRRRNLYAAVINHLCDRFRWVYDIPGNHYWYGGTTWDVCQAPVERENYTFGGTFDAGEVVAATLWADFQRGNPIVELACVRGMNDFRQIPGLTPELVKERHREHVRFLRQTIRPGCVVMTHFLPSWQSLPLQFKADPCSGYYASDLEELILDTRPALWCHGHTHTACDYMVGETRVVCNPAGYEGRDHVPGLVVGV